MRAYSIDLRGKIVELMEKGVSKNETAVSAWTGQRSSVTARNSMSAAPLNRGRPPARDRSWIRRRENSFWKTLKRGRGRPTSRVPLRSVRGEGERSDGLPGGRTSLSELQKGPKGQQKERSS